MTSKRSQLDELTALLGRCLGRIDEQSYRVLHAADDERDFESLDLLEEETGTLQELIESMLVVAEDTDHTDLNRAVERVAASCLQEVGVPIVLRQNLAPDLLPVACPAVMLTVALQRAILLAASTLQPGAELAITTRVDRGSIVVEIESRGGEVDDQLLARAETLRDFVGDMGGHCHVARDQQHSLCVALELPQALTADER